LFVNHILNILYLQKISNIDFKDNIFFNKKQYSLYLNDFYSFSYDKIVSGKAEEIKEDKYFSIPKNKFYYLLNRKYIYNRFFLNNDSMYSYALILKDIKNSFESIK
jgi:hypothetical protein